MSKPTIKRGPASRYAMTNESIYEVSTRGGPGCLLTLRVNGDGELRIDVYRTDPGTKVVVASDVTVFCDGRCLKRGTPPEGK